MKNNSFVDNKRVDIDKNVCSCNTMLLLGAK